MKLKIPESSVEYVVAEIASPTEIDAGWVVAMAFIPVRQKVPGPGDWITAEWEGTGIRVLIGPGTSKELTCGHYTVWVKINASPEAAVRMAGHLEVI